MELTITLNVEIGDSTKKFLEACMNYTLGKAEEQKPETVGEAVAAKKAASRKKAKVEEPANEQPVADEPKQESADEPKQESADEPAKEDKITFEMCRDVTMKVIQADKSKSSILKELVTSLGGKALSDLMGEKRAEYYKQVAKMADEIQD